MSKDDILTKAKSQHNDICISAGFDIVRLVGFHEDLMDYYYHVKTFKGEDEYHSAVGWLISLKNRIPDDAYSYIESVFKINGCPPAISFTESVATDEDNIRIYGRLSHAE